MCEVSFRGNLPLTGNRLPPRFVAWQIRRVGAESSLLEKAARLARPPSRDDWRVVPLGFATLISIGTLLLVLPWAHQEGHFVSTLDALFIATSAVCVTGLTPLVIGEAFNIFGQAVILLLIQLGGLGILTASTLLVLLSGERLSLLDEHTIEATIGRLKSARPFDIFVYACLTVFLIEAAGAVAVFMLMNRTGADAAELPSLWSAVFHSVSAFCNAGFSIYPEGLVRWRHQAGLLAVINILVIAGGLGLLTLINLRYYYFWRRNPTRRGALSLQARMALIMTLVLLVVGAVLTLVFEWNSTLADATGWQKLSWAVFHSTMARTAGFNAVDLGAMEPATLLATMFLMFIGGSPGSMAGGIKTVTFLILAATAWSALRLRGDITVFHRRVPLPTVQVAIMLSFLASLVVFGGIGLLLITENAPRSPEHPVNWLGLMFEAVSAFGTTGLSANVTPDLTGSGKLVVMALMFVGRVGPLVLSLHLAHPARPWRVRYPEERVSLG